MNCPKCSAPLETVPLPQGLTVETCPACSGAFYDASEINIPLAVDNLIRSAYLCPKCRGPMKVGTLYDGRLTLEQCQGCNGIWLDPGEMRKLRELSGREDVVGPASPSEPSPALFPAAGFAAFIADNKAAEVAPPDSARINDPDVSSDPTATYEGREYRHFQTSAPVVSYVLGEFNWKVAVGDKGRARDFVCPPYLLSEDISAGDSSWSHGEYLEPEEVWKAFGLEGVPPPRSGVAPAQPNPFAEASASVSGMFWAYFAACIGLFFVLAALAQNRPVFNGSFQYSNGEPEKSRVTGIFSVGGHTSNLKVHATTSLQNHWAYLGMALIDADTDEALDFGREISYYSGSDGDGAWSEGKPYDTVYLPRVKPGRYYLRVEPETDASAFQYSIGITRDVPRPLFLFLALGLLALPTAWLWWRQRNFECARWLESDHPIAPLIKTDSDEEDD